MKKIAAMTAIIALVSLPVLAAGQGGFTGPSTTTTTQAGGFTGPSGAVTTVANAKSLRDDTWVTIFFILYSPFCVGMAPITPDKT